LYENTIWFLALRDLVICIKIKIYIFFNFSMFWWKPGILISDLYLYGIKIQTNIKQNLVEKQNAKKLQFLIFFNWPNPTQPFWVWLQASPLFTFNVNSGEEDAEEEEGGEGGEGRRLTCGGSRSLAALLESTGSSAGGGAGGSRWFFSSLFFFLSLFSFSSSSFPSLLLLFVPLLFFFLLLPLSIFIGKNRGGEYP